jgi:hypothetical protein
MAKQISEDAGWKRLPKPSEDGSRKVGIDAAVLKSDRGRLPRLEAKGSLLEPGQIIPMRFICALRRRTC